MERLELLNKKIKTAEDLLSVVKTMKSLADFLTGGFVEVIIDGIVWTMSFFWTYHVPLFCLGALLVALSYRRPS